MLTDFSPGEPLLWGWVWAGWGGSRPGRAVQGRAALDVIVHRVGGSKERAVLYIPH